MINIIAKLWKVLLLNCCYHLTRINDCNVKKTMMVILTSENYMCVTLRPKSEHALVSSFGCRL